MNKRTSSLCLFLLGVGSATKIAFIGTVAISELFVFFIAPIVFLKQFPRMKREGFADFIYMMVFMMMGMFMSSAWNHTALPFVIKLFAVFYGMLAYYIVFYRLLHDNLNGLGIFFLGVAISGIITIWFFNPRAIVSEGGFVQMGATDAEDIINGPLFWIGKARDWGQLPIFMAYLKTPMIYSITTPLLFVALAMLTTISGRAQSMCVLVAGILMLIGQKSRLRMQKIGKHMILFLIAGIMVLALYKAIYSYAAASGMLGEAARSKYEHQTEAGSGMLSMLMAGRSEFFIGLIAAMDRPIMGFGPRAEDTQGYAQSYFMKYGTLDDVGSYLYTQKAYYDAGVRMVIPSHSHIIAGWQWCGLPGLIFFIWVLYRLWKHMKLYSGVIPQWFGYYALAVPSMAWSIFFNPYGARWSLGLLMVCLAFSRSVSRGKMCLPLEMQLEAMKYDKK